MHQDEEEIKKQTEKREDDELLELSDDIPFAKIREFAVEKVTVKEDKQGDKFAIHITKKCEEIPQQKDGHDIVRTFSDLSWLVQKIMKQAPHLIIVPLIQQKSYWDSIKELTGSLTHDSKKEIRKEEDGKFMCSIVQRFLRILSKVSLRFLYEVGKTHSSLFTFLDEKYEMYKMDIYQKNQETAIQSLKARFGSGTKMVLGYFTGLVTSKAPKFAAEKQKITSLIEKITKFMTEQQKYQENLSVVSKNFIKDQKQISKKESHVYLLNLKSQNIRKLLYHIQQQINFIINLSENVKGLDQKQINLQIEEYSKFLKVELEQIQKEMRRIIKNFIQATTGENVVINMSDLYTSQ